MSVRAALRFLSFLPLAAVLVLLEGPGEPIRAQVPLEFLEALEYRPIGPAVMGGRVSDLAVDESDPSTFYVGTATGGLWKTTNHGADFQPVFDDQANASIGDVTLAPGNPNLVWVGTGEPQNRQSSPWGDGVYKSLDGGKTWRHMGLRETGHIARIQIHPLDQSVAYVAAVGHLWGPNAERGVFRTTDGGETWEKVLYVNPHTGAIDLVMDPEDPNTLFAAMYQRRRTGFGFNGGGPGSGIYRTFDGGDTWVELSQGLPEEEMGRIGLDIYRGDGSIVYAIVEAIEEDGVYRSDDRGDTWTKQSDTNPRPMYYSQIRIDPRDPEQVYLGGTSFYRSSDGGRTFESLRWPGVHVDHHAIWIDPNDPDHILLGNDGGVYATFDRTRSWQMYDNMALGQFYEIGVNMEDPYWVCGGLQDNGSWCGPSRTYSENGIMNAHWVNTYGADGFYTPMDPENPNIVYAEAQTGRPSRVYRTTGETKSIQPLGRPEEEGGELPELQWNWNSPLEMSQHDPAVLYYGANVLWKTPDRGQSWEKGSPDLTKQIDRDTLVIMGQTVSEIRHSRNDGIRYYGTITQISESPLNPEVLYAGTDDGNVQVTRDGGATWTNVVDRIQGVPPRTYVSGIFASAHQEGRVYVTFDGHRNDDYAAYAFVSEDYGGSWREITNGLPATSVNRIVEHHRTPGLLFLANEVGVFFTLDRGEQWQRLKTNLPTVPVDALVIHPRENDLVVGTHGRSIWILEDLTPLEQLSTALEAELAHLFPVKEARITILNDGMGRNAGMYSAPNPPVGARIRYLLHRSGQPDHVHGQTHEIQEGHTPSPDHFRARITILDQNDDVVRTLEEPGSGSRGMHEVVWDLRMDPPFEAEEEDGGWFRRAGGPLVDPGTYTVRLEALGDTLTTSVSVALDPRVDTQASPADLQARRDAIMTLYDLMAPAYRANRVMEAMEEEVERIDTFLEGREEIAEDTRTAFDDARERVEEIADEAGDRVSDIFRLMFGIEGCHCRPTQDELYRMERAEPQLRETIDEVNRAVTRIMPDLYRALEGAGVFRKEFSTVSMTGGGGG